MEEPLYVVNDGVGTFERDRMAVDIVCAGDSITGWNNYGPPQYWPFSTYPRFLQTLCAPRGWRVADGGIAGEISDNGLGHVNRYLEHFPNAGIFVVGFGSNDLGMWPETAPTSERILDNMSQIAARIRSQNRRTVFINVPHVNESRFPTAIAAETHAKRDYHNPRLGELARTLGVPIADICTRLADEHFGDELHPNDIGAGLIAEEVFKVLAEM